MHIPYLIGRCGAAFAPGYRPEEVTIPKRFTGLTTGKSGHSETQELESPPLGKNVMAKLTALMGLIASGAQV